MIVRSYVAMGDSFTEGLDDPCPDGSGYRGWADLVATRLAELARRADPPGGEFRYANLAIRGRLFDAVVTEQVPLGLSMRPDLFTFAAGGNDVLRRNFAPEAAAARFDDVVARLRATGAEVLLFQFVDLTRRLPGRRVLGPRIDAFNAVVLASAERHGARAVDLWSDPDFEHPALWSTDRLHLSSFGHQRVAAAVLRTLGLAPDPAWLAPLPPPVPLAWAAARSADARWLRQHLLPWVGRRLTGRSSGDTVTAKRPVLTPVDDPAR